MITFFISPCNDDFDPPLDKKWNEGADELIDPGGRDLQISMASGGQNIKSIIISHVRYQIISFLIFRFHSDTPFGIWIVLKVADLQKAMISGGLRFKSMKMGHFMYQIIVFSEFNTKLFLNLRVLTVFDLQYV